MVIEFEKWIADSEKTKIIEKYLNFRMWNEDQIIYERVCFQFQVFPNVLCTTEEKEPRKSVKHKVSINVENKTNRSRICLWL